ncbi:ABC transporter ATP-binding protein [Chitinibacter bivalviorum]|uniref:ABC transporter ATP-binding protein n=1 Tax=Chitinibacter bivalviorum TaxID=2739434 RepID=A0A7H9BJV5_9NEIS|nr:ABC transporter ATP-binding protein [Chitinibacter bivalviorum]QLG88538.1 ABC transporter ATP-binding protein [Chitinibacter bivalviorum]
MTDAILFARDIALGAVHCAGQTLQIAPGQVVGLVGKNGAGKTTLLDGLFGYTLLNAGQSQVFGHDPTALPKEICSQIGFVAQQDELMPWLTGEEMLNAAALFQARWNDELVNRLVMKWGLPLGQKISSMSVGERQKLALVAAMAHEPQLLVMDEPAASLDPLSRRALISELIDIVADGKRSVLLSSHIFSDIERVASHLWLLEQGRFSYQGELDQLKESVVRVHFITPLLVSGDLPQTTQAVIRTEMFATSETWVINGWNEAMAIECAAAIRSPYQVEALSLEDIFVELSR